MSNTVNVSLGNRSYDIFIKPGVLKDCGEILSFLSSKHARFFIITNPTVASFHADVLLTSMADAGLNHTVIEVPDGEQYKNLDTLNMLYERFAVANAKRNDVVIALGGGVIGDMAGFLAATFLRGLKFAQIPTTLLAQVDSSVGGKVGVNHQKGKNLIGAFYQPQIVLVDPRTLKTLPNRELLAGLAEVFKYGFISEPKIIRDIIDDPDKAISVNEEFMADLINRCCGIKARVVEEDEHEKGLRVILNYGHTIGHALEAATGYHKYLHGEAVMLGMIAAGWMSKELGLLQAEDYELHLSCARSIGLSEYDHDINTDDVYAMTTYDKKWFSDTSRFVLLSGLGIPIVKDSMPPDLIIKAIELIKEG